MLPRVPEPDDDAIHRRLALRNELRLRPGFVESPTMTAAMQAERQAERQAEMQAELADRCIEQEFVARERAAGAPWLRNIPSTPDGFAEWFEHLRETGPGQGDPLFPWLAEQASVDDLRWFLGQELAGEAGFEDLLSLTQLKMPVGPKLEMARNFWDELGRGHASGMHGPLLEQLASALHVRLAVEETCWEPLALANLMVALAWNRHYAYQSVGALGVIELTAPDRARHVNAGLRRLGVSPGHRKYFALHATLDIQHSRAWIREVVLPLVAADARCAPAIAEGAWMRLRAGARCFDVYRARLFPRDGQRA